MTKAGKIAMWSELVIGIGYIALFATDMVLNKKKGS
jgi:hypothetical protein